MQTESMINPQPAQMQSETQVASMTEQPELPALPTIIYMVELSVSH
ncbi:hypothetical protein AALA17_00175 [Lactobacillaceae bacterium 24-114]